MKHYTYSELDAFYHGSMGKLRSISCRIHLKNCEHCQKLYKQLLDDENLISEVRQSYNQYDIESIAPTSS